MKKQNKTLMKRLRTVLFFLLVGVLLLYILIEAFAPRRTVDLFGFKPYVVLTESMEPAIEADDVVLVKKAEVDSLEEGDIITFLVDINDDGEDNVVTHYVYSIEETGSDTFEIRTHRHFEDEEAITPDRWVLDEEDVLGEHMLTVPNIGILIRFLQSPFGIAALVVNVGIIAGIVLLIRTDSKKPDKKDTE
ncbi:MAG: signal peptidase I [Candidatus Izemoplasmataceae bacterium]